MKGEKAIENVKEEEVKLEKVESASETPQSSDSIIKDSSSKSDPKKAQQSKAQGKLAPLEKKSYNLPDLKQKDPVDVSKLKKSQLDELARQKDEKERSALLSAKESLKQKQASEPEEEKKPEECLQESKEER